MLTETTANTNFALIMATALRAVELADLVWRGDWQTSSGPEHFGTDVHGNILGLIDFGRIGAAVARRGALGFVMPVRYAMALAKPALEAKLGTECRELEELLTESDFVCVTVPLSEATRHLIGRTHEALGNPDQHRPRPGVYEAALIEALETGRIALSASTSSSRSCCHRSRHYRTWPTW